METRSRWLGKGCEFRSFAQLRDRLFPSDLIARAEDMKLLDEVMLVRRVNAECGEIESAVRWLFVWSRCL